MPPRDKKWYDRSSTIYQAFPADGCEFGGADPGEGDMLGVALARGPFEACQASTLVAWAGTPSGGSPYRLSVQASCGDGSQAAPATGGAKAVVEAPTVGCLQGASRGSRATCREVSLPEGSRRLRPRRKARGSRGRAAARRPCRAAARRRVSCPLSRRLLRSRRRSLRRRDRR